MAILCTQLEIRISARNVSTKACISRNKSEVAQLNWTSWPSWREGLGRLLGLVYRQADGRLQNSSVSWKEPRDHAVALRCPDMEMDIGQVVSALRRGRMIPRISAALLSVKAAGVRAAGVMFMFMIRITDPDHSPYPQSVSVG